MVKSLIIQNETHRQLDVYRAKNSLKTFDDAIRKLLKEIEKDHD